MNSNPVSWLSPPVDFRLGMGDVHVWRACLDCDTSTLSRLESSLSLDETARAERFVLKRDRDHFVIARGILRELLCQYLKCAPQIIEFQYGVNGKPELSGYHTRASVRFNISHSRGVGLFAVSLNRRVGIDLELVRAESAGTEIAARYFSTREVNELRGLPTEQQAQGFFLCWTRKEAYVKAQGAGLQIPLNSFDVSLSPGQPATLSVDDEAGWGMESFIPVVCENQYYVAALVVEGKNYRTAFFDWILHDPSS
jgi:4'-phosphopantetheinyl transferase